MQTLDLSPQPGRDGRAGPISSVRAISVGSKPVMLELLHPRRIDRRLAAVVDAFRLSIRDLLKLPLAPQAATLLRSRLYIV
jgi:hypothetical protein